MGAGDSELRLGSARAAFLSPREYTLDFSQYALGLTEELRDGNIGRIAGECREGLETKVDANRVDWKRNLSMTSCSATSVTNQSPQASRLNLSLIHISEPTRRTPISYAVFCLETKKK